MSTEQNTPVADQTSGARTPHPKLNAENALRFVAGELKRLGAEWDGHDAHAAYKECLAGLAAEEGLAPKALDCKPLPEDASERVMFDNDVLLNGDVRATIVSTLRTSSCMFPAGSFGKRLAIMANEVAKLQLPEATASDDLETNVRYLLDKCPHTVRDLSGERTGRRGSEDLVGTLAITFLGMQSKLAELEEKTEKVHKSGARPS